MKYSVIALLVGVTLPMVCISAELVTDKQKFSYALGAQIGRNVSQQGIPLDTEAFAAGVSDILNNSDLQLTTEQMQAAAEKYQQQLKAERKVKGDENSSKGAAFMAENKKSAGVEVLDNGIQYKVLESGNGDKPTIDDTVVVHYRGTLINGQQFDSSYERGEPVEFKLSQVIQGWQEVLPLMQEGAKWQVVIPPELAYGESGAGANIGPNETLIFEIELIEVKAG